MSFDVLYQRSIMNTNNLVELSQLWFLYIFYQGGGERQVFVLPVVIVGILLLINNKKIMKEHKTSIWINIGLAIALLFACVISYNGVVALSTYF